MCRPEDMDFGEIVEFHNVTQDDYLVALAMYYHQEIDSYDFYSVPVIRDIIDSAVGTGTDTSQTLHELRDRGFIERHSEEYRLTSNGLEFCLGRLEESIDGDYAEFIEAPIDTDAFRDHIPEHDQYVELINTINRCYVLGIYPATVLMCRKLFEKLSFDLLHDIHAPNGDIDMFRDTDNNGDLRYGELLSSLRRSHSELSAHTTELNTQQDVNNLVDRIQNIKNLGDESAHSIRVNIARDELEVRSGPISETVWILYSVLRGVNQ